MTPNVAKTWPNKSSAVRGFSQLVVISHDDTFERHIDNIIRVTHTGEASAVEVG